MRHRRFLANLAFLLAATDYGDSFVNFTFETGGEKYAELQNGTYVGAGHFVKDDGKPGVVVEYKVSKVVYKA
jgi:RNA polymerase I-specific transcription initiation factor RRN6